MYFVTKKQVLSLYNCFLWIGTIMFSIGFFASGVRALDFELGRPIASPWNPMTIIGITGIMLLIMAAVGRYRSKAIKHFF